ncbi:histidine phosphatase family protein [Candidatus Magnetaquicoccus inordinatus]|uniref:histidine phosphatase family protein n=1 Tax=Candidatus Magnetaquicoccus inordinatus TaxID=2496818 RepID=UPI00102CE541|nr:histidine phosphatase family protein [Candidatus Magnetaquicoccus inordinatus]
MSTLIDLLRHGEPEGGPMYRGSLDDPLSSTGWQQMEKAIQNHPTWQAIYTSPLQRCAHFAEALAKRLSLPLIREERFREMHFGDWEGKTSTFLLEQDGQRLTSFWRDPLQNTPPNGEPLQQFQQRVLGGWEDMLAQHPDQSLLLVAHSGVIRMLLGAIVLNMPLNNLSRIVVDYAGLSRVRVDHVGGAPLPRLLFHAAPYPT